MNDSISKEKVIDVIAEFLYYESNLDGMKAGFGLDDWRWKIKSILSGLPPAQLENIRCKECIYGERDDDGMWYCRSLGCQVGNDDGSGFCADAKRREE